MADSLAMLSRGMYNSSCPSLSLRLIALLNPTQFEILRWQTMQQGPIVETATNTTRGTPYVQGSPLLLEEQTENEATEKSLTSDVQSPPQEEAQEQTQRSIQPQSVMNNESNAVQEWEMHHMLQEQQERKRRLMQQAEQEGNFGSGGRETYHTDNMELEQQNKKRPFQAQQEQGPLEPPDEDDGQISCICGYLHDDWWTVACDQYKRWQHQPCCCPEYQDRSLPEDIQHFCVDCREQEFDTQAARLRQKVWLEERDAMANRVKRHASNSRNHKIKGQVPKRLA